MLCCGIIWCLRDMCTSTNVSATTFVSENDDISQMQQKKDQNTRSLSQVRPSPSHNNEQEVLNE